MLLGVKVPLPAVDQVAPVAIVKEPFKFTEVLFAQIVWFSPAFAIGAGVIFTVICCETARQPPLLVEVRVRVTTPPVISGPLGI